MRYNCVRYFTAVFPESYSYLRSFPQKLILKQNRTSYFDSEGHILFRKMVWQLSALNGCGQGARDQVHGHQACPLGSSCHRTGRSPRRRVLGTGGLAGLQTPDAAQRTRPRPDRLFPTHSPGQDRLPLHWVTQNRGQAEGRAHREAPRPRATPGHPTEQRTRARGSLTTHHARGKGATPPSAAGAVSPHLDACPFTRKED